MTKTEMYKSIQMNLMDDQKLQSEFQQEWGAAGGALAKITTEKMQELYYKYGV